MKGLSVFFIASAACVLKSQPRIKVERVQRELEPVYGGLRLSWSRGGG